MLLADCCSGSNLGPTTNELYLTRRKLNFKAIIIPSDSVLYSEMPVDYC